MEIAIRVMALLALAAWWGRISEALLNHRIAHTNQQILEGRAPWQR